MSYDRGQTLRTVTIGAFWRLLRYPILFLSLIVIPRLMGKALYGQFAYFTTVLTICEAFTGLGNLQIFGRFIPEMGNDKAREARLLHGIMYWSNLLVAGFALLVSLFFLLVRPAGFPLRWLPILICIMVAGKIQGTTFAFLYGRNEIGRFSARELIRSALTLALIVGLYALTGSLDAALWALAITQVGLMLLSFRWGREALFRPWGRLPLKEFMPYFLFGATFYIPTVLLFFLQRSAPLFIRGLTDRYEDVAPFDLANQFLMTTGMFLGLIFTTLVPALSKLHAADRKAEVLAWNRTALAWCGAAAFLVYGALVYLGRPLVRLLLGAEFSDTYGVAVVTGLAFSPMLVSQMGMNFAVVRKKPSAYGASTVFGVAAMVGFSFLLIPRLQAVGAAWATVAGHTAVALVYAAIFRGPFLTMLRDFVLVTGLGLLLTVPASLLNWELPAMAALGAGALALYLGLLALLNILKPADVRAAIRAVRNP
ncbi:MAG: oligosaccharide flippase family protein [Kiritimatiellia bacterium]